MTPEHQSTSPLSTAHGPLPPGQERYGSDPASAAVPRLGATYLGNGRCEFLVWAPARPEVVLHLPSSDNRRVPMERRPGGYYHCILEGVEPGIRYQYGLSTGVERPDPASRFQPEGVHGASEVVDGRFEWTANEWRGLPLQAYVIYELHVGAFTGEGTFDAVIPHLPEVKDLGITAIELMPVNQFSGNRNWGYDGVYPFAAQNSYGGPRALKRLVDACHRHELAVILDVVYNHLGPEGNYLPDFGPYFTARYQTPWGAAINFDGRQSDQVRRFFIENALYWVDECRVDALRLDAVHAMFDFSARHFLAELADAVHGCARKLERNIYLIPESDLNDSRLVRSPEEGGYGLDAQWSDDFHHALRGVVTGDRGGYYQDFGSLEQLGAAYRRAFVYCGEYSEYRQRRHGNSPDGIPPHRFVVFSQNHDQIGNRMLGERLTALLDFESVKLTAAVVITSQFLPLLFMGEEYGETAPFLYFVSHADPELIKAVRVGRRAEFEAFAWQGEAPDPQSEETFHRSRLNHALKNDPRSRALREYYKLLIGLRPVVSAGEPAEQRIEIPEPHAMLIAKRAHALLIYHFGKSLAGTEVPAGRWRKLVDSADARWMGPGSGAPEEIFSGSATHVPCIPRSFLLYQAVEE